MNGNPQKEEGHTPVANELLEAMLRAGLNGTQWDVMMAIARKTYGWSKKHDFITMTQIGNMTGTARPHISRAFNQLLSANMCTKNGTLISINKLYSTWKPVPKTVQYKKRTINECERTIKESPRTINGTKSVPNMVHTKARKQLYKSNYTKASVPALKLSGLLFERIRARTPTFKSELDTQKKIEEKTSSKNWAGEMDAMLESRTYDQIEFLIFYVQGGNFRGKVFEPHHFWAKNILSPAKLREQFDKLVEEVKYDRARKNNPTPTTMVHPSGAISF